jgi:hypothetical protein
LLRNLPTPPELAEAVDICCRHAGYGPRGRDRRRVEDELKLQYYYGGWDVAYLPTPEGLVVVAAGECESDAFGKALDGLPAAERRRVVYYVPGRWNTAEDPCWDGPSAE